MEAQIHARAAHVGYGVREVALGQVFLQALQFTLLVTFHLCSILTHVSSGEWTMILLAAAVSETSSHPIIMMTVKN
jgi:hypothetical protein